MRRAYYQSISDLYYLFDDFNDRPIHFNMAMQMAGTELASLITVVLQLPEAAAFRRRSQRLDRGEGASDGASAAVSAGRT